MDIVEYNVILIIIFTLIGIGILFAWLRMIGNQINDLRYIAAKNKEVLCHMNTLLSAAAVNDKK